MQDTLTTDTPRLANSGFLLVVALLVVDSLHFVFARLLLPYISPGVSAMYVLGVGTVEVGLLGLVRGRPHFSVLSKHLWFFLAIGFLVAVSTNINYGVFTIAFEPGDYLHIGSLLVLGSAFMYAVHAAIAKRYGGEIEFLDFFFFRLLCTTGMLFLFALSRRALAWPGATAWLLLALVGTVDVVASRMLYYVASRRLKMSIHSIVLTLSPVAAIIWSLLVFNTLPTPQQLLGGTAVILGVLIVTINRNT